MSEDSGGNVNILELKELLEAYNKYMEQVNELYRLYAQGVPVVVPSTTSIPEEGEKEGCPS